jgi:hypothetical protein
MRYRVLSLIQLIILSHFMHDSSLINVQAQPFLSGASMPI